MANGSRPNEDGFGHSSTGRRPGRGANEEGLAALGQQMSAGADQGPAANEEGLRALGQQIDQSSTRGLSTRSPSPPRPGTRSPSPPRPGTRSPSTRSPSTGGPGGRGPNGRGPSDGGPNGGGPSTPGLRRSGRPKWSIRKKVLVGLISAVVLVVALVGGGYAYLWYRFGQITKVHVADEVAVANGAPFTMLVIGSDSRAGITGGSAAQAFGSSSQVTGQRSDVVQLWRVTPSAKSIQIVSIPRDTVVSLLPPQDTQQTYNRINSSYNSGPDQLVRTITANFGIPINHVVQVDFGGFQSSVDALGGVYMNFNYPAKDAYSGLNITTTGCQLLNGTQALAVARSRHYQYEQNGQWLYDGTSDFGRIQRQDAFIRSLMSAAKSKLNPFTLNSFLGSVHQGVTIDDKFNVNEFIRLAWTYHSYNPGSLAGQTLPTDSIDGFGLGSVLTIQQPAAQQMLVNAFGSALVRPTNPAPNASGRSEQPPAVTPTPAAPAAGNGGQPTTTPTTAPPPSFNPSPCTPS